MTGMLSGSTPLLDWVRQRVIAIVNANPVDYGELGVFVVVLDPARHAVELAAIAEDVDTTSVDVLVDTYYALGQQLKESRYEGQRLEVELPGIIGHFARYEADGQSGISGTACLVWSEMAVDFNSVHHRGGISWEWDECRQPDLVSGILSHYLAGLKPAPP